MSIANPKAKAYALALQRAAREAVSNYGPDAVRQEFARHGLAVSILAEFPTRRTERWGQPHTLKPDADNIAKQIDRLMAAGALGGDDSRVADLTVTKRWAKEGRLSIVVRVAEHDADRPPPKKKSILRAPGWLVTPKNAP